MNAEKSWMIAHNRFLTFVFSVFKNMPFLKTMAFAGKETKSRDQLT
jgi:hypothetical protein